MGMIPASERLHSADQLGMDRILRLEHDADLAPVQRQAKVRLQPVGVDLPALLVGGQYANALAPGLPRIGQRHARAPQQMSRVILAARLGDAASRDQADQVIAGAERPPDRADQLARQECGAIAMARLPRQTHQKFGARDPRDHRAGRDIIDHPFDPSRDPPQQRIAHHLPIGRVHPLELADRQQQHGRRQADAPVQPFQRRLARPQSGQIVAAAAVPLMLVGQPFDIRRDLPILDPQMMDQPVARPVGQPMSQGRRAPRARHRPQRRQHAHSLRSRQLSHQRGRGQRRRVERQMPRQRLADAQQPVAPQLPVKRVAAADALRALPRALLATQSFHQPLRRRQHGVQTIGGEGCEQIVRGASGEQSGHPCFLGGAQQQDQRTAARFHRRHQRREQRIGIAAPAQIDKRDLRFAAQEALRRVARPPRADRAPADRLRRLRQAVAVSGRQDEQAMLYGRCGVPAHSLCLPDAAHRAVLSARRYRPVCVTATGVLAPAMTIA